MIPLKQLLAKISAYLQERSRVPDHDYQERKQHFDKILNHLDEYNYVQLLKEVDLGIENFHHIFTSNRYADLMLELKQHLIPENASDAEKRLRKLLIATLHNNITEIETALDNGSLAVINSPYQGQESIGVRPEVVPVMAAFITKNLKACSYLLNHIDILSRQEAITSFLEESGYNEINLNPVLDKSINYCLLHFAAEYGLTDLLEVMLADAGSLDINQKKTNETTALYLACEQGQNEAAEMLLDHEAGTDHREVFNTPLWASFTADNQPMVNRLLQQGATVSREFYHLAHSQTEVNNKYETVFKIIQNHYQTKVAAKFKQKKTEIISALGRHGLFVPSNENHSSKHNAIISQIYFENPDTRTILVQQLTELLNNEDEILMPLLTIIAMAKNSQIEKPLKTIINNQNNLATLVMGGEQGTGVYRGKKSVYIAGKSEVSALGTILHEWKHYVDQAVFGNRNSTFSTPAFAEFLLISESVKNRVEQLPENPKSFANLKNSFRAVFYHSNYEKESQNAELLARVPEVFGTLGIKEGREWLENNLPELLKFYESEYNDCCRQYIKELTETDSLKPN